MDEQQKIAMRDLNNFSKSMAVATTFSVKDWNDNDWSENTITGLKKVFFRWCYSCQNLEEHRYGPEG